ncbi:MAG TPA: hypothetical protein ENK76_03860 [Campylobacterales bacterium]|nr:hypothetical protein [Campylobacterales bacterium]
MLGGLFIYLIHDCDCPKVTTQKAQELKERIVESSECKENKSVEVVKKVMTEAKVVKQIERMKTPDELYAEQEAAQAYVESDEPIEEDRDVVPIELAQIEMNSGVYTVPEIDRAIVSEELQAVEEMQEEPTVVSEDESRALEMDATEPIVEVKKAISEELMDLEEFGDSESIPVEQTIPR